MPEDLSFLPEASFADTDAAAVERDILTGFEAAARLDGMENWALQSSDHRRLFLLYIASRFVQFSNLVDHAGKMGLLKYARGAFLDNFGAQYGERGRRLAAHHAVCTVRYVLSASQSSVVVIPAGSKITSNGVIEFATTRDLLIYPGQMFGDVEARCSEPGLIGNGFVAGQLNSMINRFPFAESAVNVTDSAGGTDTEQDDPYRMRLWEAPESFSVAGSTGAYRFWALTAHAGIADVEAWMPELDLASWKSFLAEIIEYEVDEQTAEHWRSRFNEFCRASGTGPGHVNVVPLMYNGEIPTQNILDLVYETLNPDTVRPLTDFVHVLPPRVKTYDLNITYWIARSRVTAMSAIQETVTAAVRNWISWQEARLGRDINPSELTRVIMAAGAKRCVVTLPIFEHLERDEVALLNPAITVDDAVEFAGLEDD